MGKGSEMNLKKWLLAATIAAGMATGASAATLTGESSGVFTSEDAGFTCTANPLFCFFGSNTGVEGASISGPTIAWPGDTTGNNNSNPARSSLTINDTDINVGPVPIGTGNYLVGSLTWNNASSPANVTPDMFTATATIDLLFSSPSVQAGQQALSFDITNTGNPDGDDIVLSLGAFDFGFGLPLALGDGLTLNGFSTALLSGSAGTLSGNDWYNPENGESSLGIYANITAVAPVPLPAAGWLMIAGLGGLGVLRRRRKTA
ncbi:hypothetical protein ACSSVY_004135 [Roseovarius sp. MBR-51]